MSVIAQLNNGQIIAKGQIRKEECLQINIMVPKNLLPFLDEGVRVTDSDRSKFIRNAIREKLQKHNIVAA
jgi:hypothetical protein